MPISKIKLSSITADASSVDLNIDANTLYLDAANNRVGINTTSPGYGLHVSGTGVGSYVRVSNTNGTYNAKFNVENTGETTLGSHSNNPLLLLTNNIERVRIDSSGNLGLGVTPSAWAAATAFQMNGLSLYNASANYGYLGHNVYVGSLGNTYKNTGLAFAQEIGQQGFKWYTAVSGSSGTAVNTTGDFTQAMTLDTIGRLGIGVVSPGVKLDVDGSANGAARFRNIYNFGSANYAIAITGDGATAGYISQNPASGGIVIANGMRYYGGGPWTPDSTSSSSIQQLGGNIIFTTNAGLTGGTNFTPSERLRINSTGIVTLSSSDAGTNPLSSSYAVRLNLINNNNSVAGCGSAVSFQSASGTNPVYASIAGYMQGSAGGGAYGDIVFGTKADYATVSPVEAMRINSNGTVAIGVTNYAPQAATKLTIGGSVQYRGAYSGSLSASGNFIFNMLTATGTTFCGGKIKVWGTENQVNQTYAEYIFTMSRYVIDGGGGTRYYFRLKEVSRVTLENGYGNVYLYLNTYAASYTTAEQAIANNTSTSTYDIYARNAVGQNCGFSIAVEYGIY